MPRADRQEDSATVQGSEINPREKGKQVYTPAKTSIIQLILKGRIFGQIWMNVIHIQAVGSPSGNFSDGEAALDAILAAYDGGLVQWSARRAEYTTTDLLMDYVQAQFIWPVRYAYKRLATSETAGVVTPPTAPPNVSATVTFQADATGPHARGVMHIPGIAADDVVGGLIGTDTFAGIGLESAALLDEVTVAGLSLDFSMRLYNRVNPNLSEVITHRNVGETSRVNRRRTVGLGI